MQATASGCRPTLPAQGAERCAAIVSYVLGPMVERGELDWVILGGRWHGADLPGVDNAIRSLQARRVPVTVIGPGVEYDGETPLLLIRAMLESNFDQMDRHRNAERKALSDHLRSVVAQAGGDYVSAYDLECPGGRCALFDSEGGPFHFDYGHLTLAAARQIVNGIHPPQALETIDGDTPHWRVAERRQNSASARTLPSSSSRR